MKPSGAIYKTLILISFLIIVSVSTTSATESRDKLSVPPLDVYKATLKYFRNNDLQKVKKSIGFLKVIVDEIDIKYDQTFFDDINRSIGDGNSIVCGVLLNRLIYYDIHDLLTIGEAELATSGAKAKRRFKSAYLEYQLIKKQFEESNFKASSRVGNAFRAISQLINRGSGGSRYSYSREKSGSINIKQIAKISHGIKTELGKVFN